MKTNILDSILPIVIARIMIVGFFAGVYFVMSRVVEPVLIALGG